MKTTRIVFLALVVLLALTLSVPVLAVSAGLISLPIVGETTSDKIEGNPSMVITGTPESGSSFEYDAIPTIPQPMGIRMDVALLNLAVRPEADATLGVVIGTAGCLSYDEWRARAAAEKSYSEKTRSELRRAHLGSIDHPGRWITAIRTGRVAYPKQQKYGQNSPLMFTAYLEPSDLQPGINTFIIRVHGIMEQRKEGPSLTKVVNKLIMGKDGKSIFGTYDEPWLVNVGEDHADFPAPTTGAPATGNYVTPQELQLALNNLEEKIRAMLATPKISIGFVEEGGCLRVNVKGQLPSDANFSWKVRNGNQGGVDADHLSQDQDKATFGLAGYNPGDLISIEVVSKGQPVAYGEYRTGGS